MGRNREPWQAAFHDVAKSQTRLGNWTMTTICSQVSLSVIHSLNKYFWVPTKCYTQYLVLCASLFMEPPLSPISLSLPWTLNLQHTTYTTFLPNPEILSPRSTTNVSFFSFWSFLTSILPFPTRYRLSSFWLQSTLYFRKVCSITKSIFKLFLLSVAHLFKNIKHHRVGSGKHHDY